MSDSHERPPEASRQTDEIKSEFGLRIGKHISLHASASITPKGVVAAGIAVAIMTLASACLVSSILRSKAGREPKSS